MANHKKRTVKQLREVCDYDTVDTTSFVNTKKTLTFKDLGLELPEAPPTQVISIRLPTRTLNELKALGSERDVPYQALIKLFLAQALVQAKKKQTRIV